MNSKFGTRKAKHQETNIYAKRHYFREVSVVNYLHAAAAGANTSTTRASNSAGDIAAVNTDKLNRVNSNGETFVRSSAKSSKPTSWSVVKL